MASQDTKLFDLSIWQEQWSEWINFINLTNLNIAIISDTNLFNMWSQYIETTQNTWYWWNINLANRIWTRNLKFSGIIKAQSMENLQRLIRRLELYLSTWFVVKITALKNIMFWTANTDTYFRNCRLNNSDIFEFQPTTLNVVKFNFDITCEDWYWENTKVNTIWSASINIWDQTDYAYTPATWTLLTPTKVIINLASSSYSGEIAYRIMNSKYDDKISSQQFSMSWYNQVIIDCNDKNPQFYWYNTTTWNKYLIPAFWNFPRWVLPEINNYIRIYFSNSSAISSYSITYKDRF